MTSSREVRVVPRAAADRLLPLHTPDLGDAARPTRQRTPGTGDAVAADMLGAIAAETRQLARAEGWSTGWSQGMTAAREEGRRERERLEEQSLRLEAARDARLREALSTLGVACHQLSERAEAVEAEALEQGLALALALAETVLGAAAAAQPAADVVARALREVPAAQQATLRLPPEVAAQVDADALPAGVRVTADERLVPGDAVVDLAEGIVDLRIHRALARAQEVLR